LIASASSTLFDLSIQQGVHPKELQAITLSLFCAEPYFLVTILLRAGSILQIFKGDLIRFPYVRKYSIFEYGALKELGQAEIAIAVIV
jgi:hypothetical protein